MKKTLVIFSLIIFSTMLLNAEKVMIFDENKGIIFIEKEKVNDYRSSKNSGESKKTSTKALSGKKNLNDKEYYKVGEEYWKDGEYDEALKLFRKAYRSKPLPRYYYWQARCLQEKEQDGFKEMFLRIIKQNPDSDVADDALFMLGYEAELSRNYEEALEYYRNLIVKYPYGKSEVNHLDLPGMARSQISLIKSDVSRRLDLLNIRGNTMKEKAAIFRKKIGLPPASGELDRKTVSLLIKYSERKEKETELLRVRQEKQSRLRKIFGTGFLLLNLFLIAAAITANLLTSARVTRLSMIKEEEGDTLSAVS
ncbi:MAG: tetratricopeptide repeat protein [Fibrobacterota bacterium]